MIIYSKSRVLYQPRLDIYLHFFCFTLRWLVCLPSSSVWHQIKYPNSCLPFIFSFFFGLFRSRFILFFISFFSQQRQKRLRLFLFFFLFSHILSTILFVHLFIFFCYLVWFLLFSIKRGKKFT